jgi:hypothetical protein
MLKVDGDFEYPSLNEMLAKVFRSRGLTSSERRTAVKHANNFYSIASSLIHGGQGAFYDLMEEQPDFAPAILHLRSYRLNAVRVMHDSIFYLTLCIFAESLHRGEYLGADMYWRELELTSGIWLTSE